MPERTVNDLMRGWNEWEASWMEWKGVNEVWVNTVS